MSLLHALPLLKVRAVVGGQPVEVEVEVRLDGPLTDGPWLLGELQFLLDACGFSGAAEAASALLAYVLAPPPPDVTRRALGKAAITVQIEAQRATAEGQATSQGLVKEQKVFGEVDIVQEAGRHGIYRLRVRAGGTIPVHVHRHMQEHELALSDGLLLQGAPITRGTAVHWPHGFPHRYDNPTAAERTILCVDCPRFDPKDEVEVAATALQAPRLLSYAPGRSAP